MMVVMVSALAPMTAATHVRRTVHCGRPLNRVLRLLHAVYFSINTGIPFRIQN